MEKTGETREKRKPRAWVAFGLSGHESEYVLAADTESFPPDVESELQKELGEYWEVLDRGTRIEIRSKKTYGAQNNDRINTALQKVLSPHGYEFKQN